jgi:hypothetical protein
VEGVGEPFLELVAPSDDKHSQADARDVPQEADDHSLAEEDPDDLSGRRAERLHDADIPSFLHGYRDERVHDAKGRNDDDKEQDHKHHVSLEANGVEEVLV